MNRAHNAEVTAVRERLVTAAKAAVPVTRRAAQQLREDLFQWERWVTAGYELPRLPRRIRVALTKPTKKSLPRKNKLQKRSQNSTRDIKSVSHISEDESREIVSANLGTCMAIAQAIIGRYRLAEECVSECMVSALEQIAQRKVTFTTADKVTAWLHQIVRYSARRVMRKAVYVATSDVDFNVANTPIGEDIEDKILITDECADEGAYRTVGRSKRCPTADEQTISFSV